MRIIRVKGKKKIVKDKVNASEVCVREGYFMNDIGSYCEIQADTNNVDSIISKDKRMYIRNTVLNLNEAYKDYFTNNSQLLYDEPIQIHNNNNIPLDLNKLRTPTKIMMTNINSKSPFKRMTKKANLPHNRSANRRDSFNRKNLHDKYSPFKLDKNTNPLNEIGKDIESLINIHNDPNSIRKAIQFDDQDNDLNVNKGKAKQSIDVSDSANEVDKDKDRELKKKYARTNMMADVDEDMLNYEDCKVQAAMMNKKRVHKKNRITGNYYRDEVDVEAMFTKSNGGADGNFNNYNNLNEIQEQEDVGVNYEESNHYYDDYDNIEEQSLGFSKHNIDAKGNKKRNHKKNKPLGNVYQYTDQHDYNNYDNSSTNFQKDNRISLYSQALNSIKGDNNNQIRLTKHISDNQENINLLSHINSGELLQINKNPGSIYSTYTTSSIQPKPSDLEKLSKYLLSSYPLEMSFRFQNHLIRYHRFKLPINYTTQLTCLKKYRTFDKKFEKREKYK